MKSHTRVLLRCLTTGVLVVGMFGCVSVSEVGHFVVDHRGEGAQWISVDRNWRMGKPLPEAEYVPRASGWEERSDKLYEKGRVDSGKVVFHDPAVVLLVSIQSGGEVDTIAFGPFLPIIPAPNFGAGGSEDMKIDIELYVPDGETNDPVEIDLLQTEMRFDGRRRSFFIHKRRHRSLPGASKTGPSPNCYASQPDCWVTIEPGQLEAGQIFLREVGVPDELEIDFPPMRLPDGRIVDAPPLYFTHVSSVVHGVNVDDPY